METKGEREVESSDWWSRDGPRIDWDNEDGNVGERFEILFRTDDGYDWKHIYRIYEDAGINEREAINRIFIHLCGYSLVTIIEKARDEIQERLNKEMGEAGK